MKTPHFNYLAPDLFMIYKVMKYSFQIGKISQFGDDKLLLLQSFILTSRVLYYTKGILKLIVATKQWNAAFKVLYSVPIRVLS